MNSNAAALGELNGVFESVVKALLPLAAIACVVMIVIGGFNYLSAGGDKEGAMKAQKTLTYAIGGLILTISAWMILSLVGNFLGISVSEFNICLPGFSGPNCT